MAMAAMHATTTARGFEPLRAEPNGFLVHHLSHSVTLSWKLGHLHALEKIPAGVCGMGVVIGDRLSRSCGVLWLDAAGQIPPARPR